MFQVCSGSLSFLRLRLFVCGPGIVKKRLRDFASAALERINMTLEPSSEPDALAGQCFGFESARDAIGSLEPSATL